MSSLEGAKVSKESSIVRGLDGKRRRNPDQ
jgi:hypothetical protein